MGRPALKNREGRGVRQLKIHHNERTLGITGPDVFQRPAMSGPELGVNGPLVDQSITIGSLA
jgi:hypothetical protein